MWMQAGERQTYLGEMLRSRVDEASTQPAAVHISAPSVGTGDGGEL